MAFESIKNLFGQVKPEEPQDALRLYLSKVDQALAAIDAITADEKRTTAPRRAPGPGFFNRGKGA